jgi:transcriptional regulator with XRE-family HTH domain
MEPKQVIREWRLAAGLTLRVAAKSLGYSASFLSDVERGYRRPSLFLLQQLDELLQTGGLLVRARAQEPDAVSPPRTRPPASATAPKRPHPASAHQKNEELLVRDVVFIAEDD